MAIFQFANCLFYIHQASRATPRTNSARSFVWSCSMLEVIRTTSAEEAIFATSMDSSPMAAMACVRLPKKGIWYLFLNARYTYIYIYCVPYIIDIYMYIYIYTYYYTLHYIRLHCTLFTLYLHHIYTTYTSLDYITLHYTALHYVH